MFDGEQYAGGDAVVLVDGQRIEAVLPGDADLPAGCEVVAYDGATVVPGLVDVHVHLCCDSGPAALDRIPDCSDDELDAVIEKSLADQLAAGVTAVRDLGDRSWAVVDWRGGGDRSGFPAVVASGPPITVPQGHCWNMGGAVSGPDELRQAVRERAERGADLVKIMASGGVNTPGTDPAAVQFDVEELRLVVDEARAVGLPVIAHAHSLNSIKYALAAGVDGIEHCSFLGPDGLDVADSVVADLVSSRTTVCPTLGARPGAVPPPAVLELMRRTGLDVETRGRLYADLYRAGVHLVSGSDAGINPGKYHGVLPESVIAMVAGGIPSTAALASATSQAAIACRFPRKGRVVPGYDADLVVVPGNPVDDITALRSPVAVYLMGTRVS
ncbi:imidazolonepropionase-like amidohydrolase [Kribbella voronezhensis]|uniref:Imidazolonepropionase-like amidohydrolase n=1 Tax=Kribbella voronezhensis TaxID=2512212 RepID=A0A4R7TAH1_9ACTN|nr:imidazolonepropionase-like amidohydrolase [Kribbella voronezhensis]